MFAEMAWSLGFLEPKRRLSELEWRSLISTVRAQYEEVDVRRSQVVEQLGRPSFMVSDRALCYIGPTDSEWIAFDCWEEPITKYVVEDGNLRPAFRTERAEDPLLRDVRIPAPSFNESLIMTTYGKVLRWGPSWWLRTPPARDTGAPEGVREQLRDINNSDPSQSLGPLRP